MTAARIEQFLESISEDMISSVASVARRRTWLAPWNITRMCGCQFQPGSTTDVLACLCFRRYGVKGDVCFTNRDDESTVRGMLLETCCLSELQLVKCDEGPTNNGFASINKEYHVHGDQLQLHRSKGYLQRVVLHRENRTGEVSRGTKTCSLTASKL